MSRRIALIAGDGVGQEVIPAGTATINLAVEATGERVEWQEFEWGSAYFLRHGRMMPADGLETLAGFDAVYLGAVGDPRVPEHVAVQGLVLAIRRGFDQYVNYRPIRLLPGIDCPLRTVPRERLDIVFVRENVEGEYAGRGGRLDAGLPTERAFQIAEFSRRGIERIARFAFEAAANRRQHVTSVSKSNALQHSMVLWDDVVEEVSGDFPDVDYRRINVDAAAYELIMRPDAFDVVLASNLFGDILTDLGAALQGSLGVAASANLDPTGANPSMFEPVHGSAPDIAGRGIANPTGAIWAGALMLDHLGLSAAANAVTQALAGALSSGAATPDLGGSLSTEAFTQEVMARIE